MKRAERARWLLGRCFAGQSSPIVETVYLRRPLIGAALLSEVGAGNDAAERE
jgi:hypothetical protein